MDHLDFILAFLNSSDTSQDGNDLLEGPESCKAFFSSFNLARADIDWRAVAPKIRNARERLQKIFVQLTADDPDYPALARKLNSSLIRIRWSGAVQPGDDELDIVFGPHQDQPYGEQIVALASVALVRLTSEIGHERMRTCQAPPCVCLFVDHSKSGRQRYCSKRCANRINVAAHRKKKRLRKAE